jgi:N-acetylglucosaminyl-diphospho-decaprenol L-rhamnosyltransferase
VSRAVSGIVVNYRTKDLTLAAVESLLDEPELEEVIVVDNDSSDGSVQYLRDRLPPDRVKVVESDGNVGFGRGVNIGAGESKGSSLFILNSDAVLKRGGLGPLVKRLEAEQAIAVVAPWVLDAEGSVQLDSHGDFPSFRTMLLRTNRHPPDRLRPDWVSGVAMLVRRQAFEQVGGFDPDFHMYLEDVDLCRRLHVEGWEITRVPESRVTHASGASSKSQDRERLYHDSLMMLLRKSGASEMEIRIIGAAHRIWSLTRSTRSAMTPPRV